MASGFKTNAEGVRAVFSGAGARAALAQIIEPVGARANANAVDRHARYETYVDSGAYTAIGKVVCGNVAARRDNARHNTILKSR